MFAGRFDHALDDKGRTMMPRRFRERLAVTEDDIRIGPKGYIDRPSPTGR